jgi:hypothetical protein
VLYCEANNMRAFLHLLSIVLVLPGVALAGAFLILGHAIAAGSLFGFLAQLLAVFLWLIPWGLLATLVALLALVIGGLSERYRWLAALCVAALAVLSTTVVLALTMANSNFSPGQLWFFLPAAVSAAVGAWLAVSEWPRGRRARAFGPVPAPASGDGT